MNLRDTLAEALSDGELSLALIVGRDGLLIEGQSGGGQPNADQIAALAAGTLLETERVGRAIGIAVPSRIRLHFERHELLIEPLSDGDILVVGTVHPEQNDHLQDVVDRHKARIVEALNDS